MALRDQILDKDDLPRVAVEVPEWEATVYVRAMTGYERDLYEADLMELKDSPLKDKLKNMRAKLAVLCTVDEDGKRVFEDDDIDAVSQKSAKALNRVVEVAQKHNAISDEDIEDMAGN